MNERKPRHFQGRIWKFLRWTLYVCAGLGVAIWLASNILLQTRALRGTLAPPPKSMTLEYTKAYSPFPGRVHLEGFSLQGQDGSIEWRLTVDRARVQISLPDLVRRRFHATRLWAEGVTFRVRRRMDAKDAVPPEYFAALPPIEGFADPPLKPQDPGATEPGKWSIELEKVDAMHVREVWIDTIRQAGDMHVQGRWLLVPTTFTDVGPVTVEGEHVTLSYGKTPFATDLRAHATVTLDPMDVREVTACDFLHHLHGRGEAEGIAHPTKALQVFVLPSGSEGIGDSPLECSVGFDRGVFVDGTHVELASAPTGMRVGDQSFKGVANFRFDVARAANGAPVGSVRSTMTSFQHSDGKIVTRAREGDVSLATAWVDLCNNPFSSISLSARTQDASFAMPDLRMAAGNTLLESKALAIDYENLTTQGDLDVSSTGFSVLLGKEVLSGSMRAVFHTRADHAETHVTNSSLAFDGTMTPDATPWWARITLPMVKMQAKGKKSFAAQVSMHAKNASPAIAFVAPQTGIPRWVLEAASMDDLRASGELRFAPGLAEIRSLRAKGGSQSVAFEWCNVGEQSEWLLFAQAPPLRAGIHSQPGSLDVRVLDVEPWFERIAKSMHESPKVR